MILFYLLQRRLELVTVTSKDNPHAEQYYLLVLKILKLYIEILNADVPRSTRVTGMPQKTLFYPEVFDISPLRKLYENKKL